MISSAGPESCTPGITLTEIGKKKSMQSPLYFEDLAIGQTWNSARRTVTESDVVIFAGMTGDFDRLHVDHEYARDSRFGQPLAHGMMGLAWAAGLSTTAPNVNTLALVEVRGWQFLRPVHVGDTVYARTEIEHLEPAGRSAGRVVWKKSLWNQDGEQVQVGQFVSLVELASRRVPRAHLSRAAAGKSHTSSASPSDSDHSSNRPS